MLYATSIIDRKQKEFPGSKTINECEGNFVKDSYNFRGKLRTSSNRNAEITKFRQNHTPLVFKKEKQMQSNNEGGNKSGKGNKEIVICSRTRAW